MALWKWRQAVAVAVVFVSLACLTAAWALCLFGTSDDGLHCVPAVVASVVAGPLAAVGALGAWAARRQIRDDRR